MKSETRWSLALLLVGLAFFAWQSISLDLCIQDDAFISLRYARNLAEGQGLVYNPGERVEGYTNFAWTVLSALPFALDLDPLGFLRWTGIFCGLLALLAAAGLAREAAPNRPLAPALAVLLGSALPTLAAEAAMGLETLLFAALGGGGIALYLRERRCERAFPYSALVLAGAALTRPEGLLIATLAAVAELHRARLDRTLLLRAGLFLAPVASLFLFRITYYGDLVPNTFHAKVGGGLAMITRGLAYTASWTATVVPLLLLAAWAVYCLWREGKDSPQRWILVLLPAVFTLYVTYVGGDYKPTYRFFALPTVFILALGAKGLDDLGNRLRRWPQPALFVVALLCAAGLWQLGSPAREFAAWRRQQLPIHLEAGRWLGEAMPEGTWLAAGNAGVLPFTSRLPTIDMFGLCDKTIARREIPLGQGLPGHEKGDGAYVLSRTPDIILFQFARFSEAPISLGQVESVAMSLSERELWSEPGFHEAYRLRSQRMPGFYFNFFERK